MRESLRIFFLEEERKACRTFDESAFSLFCAPDYPLGRERFIAPWIETAPTICHVAKDGEILPRQMEGRVIYVGADFFLTMMTCLEEKNGPRSRTSRSSELILRLASEGKIKLVTSAGEFNRFIGIGAALLEAHDQVQLDVLVNTFKTEGTLAPNGANKLTGKMSYLPKLGRRIVSPGVDEYSGPSSLS